MVRKITVWSVLLPYLQDYNRTLLLADFEKELKIKHQTLSKYIKELINNKILKKEKREKYSSYSLNFKNPLIFDYLSISEKMRTFVLLDKSMLLKRLYEQLSNFFSKNSFLIFGSFAEQLKGNDIDLLIIGKVNKELKKTIKEFSLTYGIKVHIVATEIRDLTKTFIQEILKKHILLNNSDLFINLFIKWKD